jgi:hypothetical protein
MHGRHAQKILSTTTLSIVFNDINDSNFDGTYDALEADADQKSI